MSYNKKDKHGLMPLDWQVGAVAMSDTHFYMIHTDKKEGITVNWTNRITNASDKRHSFESKEDARDWIINTHHAEKNREAKQNALDSGFTVGMQWVNRSIHTIILEIVEIDRLNIYAMAYSSANKDNTSGVFQHSIFEFSDFIKKDYYAMNDGETIADCLLRHGVKK